MFGTSLIFSLLALQSAVPAENAQEDTTPLPLTATQKQDLRCSAAFAIIASEQERRVPWAQEWPRLSVRGKDFFTETGLSLIRESGRTREQVSALMVAEVTALQDAAAGTADPNAIVDAIRQPCLERLGEVVAPLEKPDLVTCAGIMELAYREVHGREGLSASAKDLKTLASVLDDRARKQLLSQGKSANESDRILGEARDGFAAASAERAEQGLTDPTDYDHCFDLAAPEPQEGSPHF